MATASPVNEKATRNPGQHGMQTCRHCGAEIFYSVSMSTGSRWLHSETYLARCAKKES